MNQAHQRALIFIESNTSGTGFLFAREARRLGFRPVLVTADPKRYPFMQEDEAPEVIVSERAEEASIYELIRRRFGSGGEVAGITSSSEYYVGLAAALAARFGLPGPDAACVEAARDKARQREALATAGLPSPEYRVVHSSAGAVQAARAIGFPVVVKPARGSGSVGVRACANVEEVETHAGALLRVQPEARPKLLVESHIPGIEVSVELFSGRVVGITRKHLGPSPHFVETGHDYPAELPAAVSQALLKTVTQASGALGLRWGPIHWELRVRGSEAVPVEVNPRLAGGFIPELVRFAEGVDLIRQTLRLAVGMPVDLSRVHRRHASIRFLLSPGPGRLGAVEGLDRGRATAGVVDVAIYRRPGDDLTPRGDFRDRIGHVIACADTGRAAGFAADRALKGLRVRLERPSTGDSDGARRRRPAGAREGAA